MTSPFSPSEVETAQAIFSGVYTPFPTDAAKTILDNLATAASQASIRGLNMILKALGTRPGMLLLTGHNKSGWQELSPDESEAVLLAWGKGRIPMLRKLSNTFIQLANAHMYSSVPEAIIPTSYPYHSANPSFMSSHVRDSSFAIPTFTPASTPFETEVLVIGTGAGGGVVGARLAEAGYKVSFVEKGAYRDRNSLFTNEREALNHLFEGRALVATQEGTTTILAGSTLGGGTTVNWSGSLSPPWWLREGWKKKGIEWATTRQFQESVDAVCERVGVTRDVKHGRANQMLIEGARKAGYDVNVLPQNSAGKTHKCGFCTFGCPSGTKNGTVNTYLSDANKAGAKFLLEHEVERVLFCSSTDPTYPSLEATEKELEQFSYSPWYGRTRAVGAIVKDKEGKKKVIVAKKGVIVSAGALHSPAVLLRSGIKNPWLGKNLRLHPSGFVMGWFDEDIKPWEGDIMTTACLLLNTANRDGTHHGSKIITMQASLMFHSTIVGFRKGREAHKSDMANFKNCLNLSVVTRDRDGGTVSLDPNGAPIYNYTLSTYDSVSHIEGLIAAANIHYALGAKRIRTTQIWADDFEGGDEEAFESWKQNLRAAGTESKIGSAHQMGTCKMGKSRKEGVTDPRGAVWGTQGLYVADTSLFPDSSGVNPMVTCMSVAHFISRFIEEDLRTDQLGAKL
ncbi:hypothetical protein BT69DRAFT_1218738 [Atractiella rhizophila]|nr:hypothetical protein BT69DRAFT_1218738 [Atractiella rhizophila]